MFFKVLLVSLTVYAVVQSAPQNGHHQHGHATSYSTFTQHHVQGGHHQGHAPATLIKAAPVHQVQVLTAAPAHSSGHGLGLGLGAYASQGHQQSYSSLSHGSPVVQHHVVQAAPVLIKSAPSHHHEEHYPDAHPHYSFKYGVEDHHTGDIKSHEESRDGDVVKGEYSVHQPDGTILRVQYHADKHSGFNAVVHREGHASHPQHTGSAKAPSHHY